MLSAPLLAQTPAGHLPPFWDHFAANYWEKKPLAVQKLFDQLPIAATALFQCVARCVSSSVINSGVGIRFYIDGQRQKNADVYHILPQEADASFEGYDTRVQRMLPGKSYSLVVNFPEIVNPEIWTASRGFLRGLFERVGMNKLGVYNALFIGNYKRTPFGVHVDPESVFHIPFVGTKKIRVWSTDFANSHPLLKQSLQYDAYLNESQLLEAGPGGLLYWPSEAWHIGESDGTLSVSMALSLNCFPELASPLLHHLLALYEKSTPPAHEPATVAFNAADPQQTASQLPAPLRRAGAVLQEIGGEKALRLLWLKLVTGYNFLNVPLPQQGVSVAGGDWVRGDQEYPAVYLQLDGRQLAISANGHVFFMPNQPVWPELLRLLNVGTPQSVDALLEAHTNPFTARQDVLRFLNQLLAFRAIHRVDTPVA